MNTNKKIVWVIGIIATSALVVSVANAYNLGKLISGDIYGNTPTKSGDTKRATPSPAPGPWEECPDGTDCSGRSAGESMGELSAPYLSGDNAKADFAGGQE